MAFLVATAPLAVWGAPSVVIQASPVQQTDVEAMRVAISFVAPGQEEAAVREALAENPDATFSIITSDKNTEVNQALEQKVAQKTFHGSVNLVRLNEEALLAESERLIKSQPGLREKFDRAVKEGRRHAVKDFTHGMLATVAGSAGFATSFYLITGEMETSSKLFALVFALNAFQAVFNGSWQKYLRWGGTVAKKFHQTMAKVIGKTLESGRVSEDIGRLFAATGFNVGVAGSVMAVQDAFASAALVVMLGTVGTWDSVWDLALGRHSELGALKPSQVKKFARYRIVFAPLIEGIVYTGGAAAIGAAAVMGVVGTTGLFSFLAAKEVNRAMTNRQTRRAEAARRPRDGRSALQDDKAQSEKTRAEYREMELNDYLIRFDRSPLSSEVLRLRDSNICESMLSAAG